MSSYPASNTCMPTSTTPGRMPRPQHTDSFAHLREFPSSDFEKVNNFLASVLARVLMHALCCLHFGGRRGASRDPDDTSSSNTGSRSSSSRHSPVRRPVNVNEVPCRSVRIHKVVGSIEQRGARQHRAVGIMCSVASCGGDWAWAHACSRVVGCDKS
jgi:hypothetical protein